VGEATMLAALSPSAPLLCKGLAEASGDDGTTLARRLSLPDRVARVLVDGDDGLPTDLPLVLEPVRPLAELCLADHQPDELTTVDTLRHLLGGVEERPIWITGPQGVGRKTLIAAVADEVHLRTLCLDHRLIRRRKPDELIPALWREVLLGQALIVIH